MGIIAIVAIIPQHINMAFRHMLQGS